jgi:hypothetical protein
MSEIPARAIDDFGAQAFPAAVLARIPVRQNKMDSKAKHRSPRNRDAGE